MGASGSTKSQDRGSGIFKSRSTLGKPDTELYGIWVCRYPKLRVKGLGVEIAGKHMLGRVGGKPHV